MNILVINCGSSSIRAAVIQSRSGKTLGTLRVERLCDGVSGSNLKIEIPGNEVVELACPSDEHEGALSFAIKQLMEKLGDSVKIAGVGHRVVHGGRKFDRPVVIDAEVEQAIEDIIPLAPLHNPANLAGIRAAKELFGDLKHIAVFDTAFHRTLPRRARQYAIDPQLAEKHQIERFGFHGVSHQYVARKAADFFKTDERELRVITCHLGNGCSLAAVEYGRSIETSMGMTPLEGLVMGTRSGDIDPGALIYLAQQEGFDINRVDELLNRESGLAGLSGIGNDMRDIEKGAADGDERCRLAIQVFAHRVRKYIGAYAAVMGGVDAIVFTGGIGENSALMRSRIGQRLEFLGARMDLDKNREAKVGPDNRVESISADPSRCQLLVVATNEEHGIAEQAAQVLAGHQKPTAAVDRTIPIAVSARHVHLTQETVEALFGEGYELTPRNPLSQPGQFACEELVTLVGPKNSIERVRILGPTRSANQVEISRTDEFALGVDAPVRGSGDIENSPGITLRTDHGEVTLEKGLICALRHIHMTPEDATNFGVKDGDMVEIAVTGGERDLIFGDVLIRVSPKYKLEMHIDTDEGNAAHLSRDAQGALLSTEATGIIRSRRTRFDTAAE
ncbi:acetate/propionate family kinase [Bradymonas sediminis]|uniref:Acetate kinase n=1 Tax=Bradymonas sediminis TaxID=1548548 RepID=A0A2Z4FPT1_9DELT|nr:acetate/propionate family kinase [Bradymonas sediminis]AWV90902.1 acetate/propionate family kinase [Bradymonas sediminis]TDP75361.1 acetate kinase [Bradymonas sediminis]